MQGENLDTMGKNIRWIVILVSVFMIISLSRSVVDLWGRRNIVEQEQKRLSELEKKHEELVKKHDLVQTPAFIEREARDRLGMAKEGDTVILMDQSSVGKSSSQKTTEYGFSEELPNWKQWWGVFF